MIHNLVTVVKDLQVVQHTASPRSTTTGVVAETSAISNYKDRAIKELQSRRINKPLDSTSFCGSTYEDVSDWLEMLTLKCDQVKLDDQERMIITTDLLKGSAKL